MLLAWLAVSALWLVAGWYLLRLRRVYRRRFDLLRRISML